MKAKILFALAALLMLGSVSLNAQEVGNSSNSESTTQLEGDLNHDNKVDVADVTYLVNLIMKNKSEAKDGVYYWYIGTENPSSISNIQTDNTVAGWHEIGTSISGFEHNTALPENEVVLNRDHRVPAYIVIPNELHIYNGLGQIVDNNPEIYSPQECNISGYKSFYIVPDVDFPEGFRTMAGPIIKEGISVSEVSISTSESSINVGNTLQLEATVEPSNATNQNVTWSSSNPEIATVDETTGLVTGIALGTATIIATSVDGGKTATTRVEVVETLSNYYWYIGVENPSSISNIQTDNTKPGWHEIGASLSGFVLDGNTNTIELYTTNTKSYYYIIIPNKLGIYDGLGNDMTTTSDFEEVTCNINGYKAYKSTYQVRIVQGEIIKESTSNKPINDNFYWYIGAENPSSISNIQTDNTKPGWHEIGTSLDGFELHTTNNPIEFTSKTRYYLVIPNELNVYDDDETDGKYIFGNNTIECNIPGYKAYQYYNQYGVWDVTGIIIKEGTPVSGVSISTSESSINVGNTLQLEATVSPSNATNQNVTWSSSNPEIATVDETTGLVTGVSIGTTTIIATSIDGGKTATTRVEVVETLSNYYWYIGVENPSSISNIQTDNTKPGWHEIGTSISGFVLDTNTSEIVLSTTRRCIYYVIIPDGLHIYNGFNQICESFDFETQECNISGYKSFKYIPVPEIPDGVRIVSGPIIK